MRSAIYAAGATLIAAIGIAAGSAALAADTIHSPEPLLASRHQIVPYVLSPEVVLAERHQIVWPAPLVTEPNDAITAEMDLIRETREAPETAQEAFVEVQSTEEASPEPETQPTPEPPPASHSGGVEQWRGLVATYFSADKVEMALCIMGHESGGNPGATNSSSGAAGLFQFIPSTWSGMVPDDLAGDVYDPETNVRAAAWLQGAAGWSQWNPYNAGKC